MSTPSPAQSPPFLSSTCCCWDCQRLLRLLLLLLLLLVLLHARLSRSAQAATVYIALFCLNGICTWKKIRAKNTTKILPAKKQNAKKKWQRRNCEMGKENKSEFHYAAPRESVSPARPPDTLNLNYENQWLLWEWAWPCRQWALTFEWMNPSQSIQFVSEA